jgi:hypothetical protein
MITVCFICIQQLYLSASFTGASFRREGMKVRMTHSVHALLSNTVQITFLCFSQSMSSVQV